MLNVSILLFITLSALANDQYQKTLLFIKNNADYPVLLMIDYADGQWKVPVTLHEPILLNKNESYQNAVFSIKKEDDIENFISLDIAQVGNVRENYLIFAENTSVKSQSASGDIVDGLGEIFVKSDTNYCKGSTQVGEVYCELMIASQ